MPGTVSIGILCYNQRDVISEVIESALRQSRPADEVLVVDDGSDDGSPAVVSKYAGVRLIVHQRNLGRAAARTTVLEHARCDVVAYLDGDTVAAPDLLQHLLAAYADPDVAAVAGVVSETRVDTIWDRWRARNGTRQDLSRPDADAKVLFGWGLSCRREIGLRLGGFRPAAEDIDFSYRLYLAGHRLMRTPDARVFHTRTDDHKSLAGMVYRWSFGGYVAFARNGDRRYGPHLQRMIRRVAGQLRNDLLIEPDVRLAAVTLLMIVPELRGLVDAPRYLRKGSATWPRIPGL
ncbi:MAG: glycosyltransferase [Streptosporangiaceae bacterium]